MTGQKEPNAIDVEIGARLRQRRIMLSISQEKLGEALGVSFQQVQKYEKGTNRISAGRMEALAKVLKVPVGFFYGREAIESPASSSYGPGFGEQAGQPSLGALPPLDDAEARRLVEAFTQVRDPKVRRRILDLVDALTRSEGA